MVELIFKHVEKEFIMSSLQMCAAYDFKSNSQCHDISYSIYRIARKFGGELNLAVWWSIIITIVKLNPPKYPTRI